MVVSGFRSASTGATNHGWSEDGGGGGGGGGVYGTVTKVRDGLAVLEGIRGDTPPGRVIEFEGGGGGVLLAHREPQSFALVLDDTTNGGGGHHAEAAGRRAPELDGATPGRPHDRGPRTVGVGERALATEHGFTLPDHTRVRGLVVGCLGQPLPDSAWGDGPSIPPGEEIRRRARQLEPSPGEGTAAGSELLRPPPVLDELRPITTSLITGVKAVEMLTPIGCGQCMLLSGEAGAG